MAASRSASGSGSCSNAFAGCTNRLMQPRHGPTPARLYVPSINEATHPRCCDEGYPDGPGRASNKEGESWVIILKFLSESIRQNCVMQRQLPIAAVAARSGISGSERHVGDATFLGSAAIVVKVNNVGRSEPSIAAVPQR